MSQFERLTDLPAYAVAEELPARLTVQGAWTVAGLSALPTPFYQFAPVPETSGIAQLDLSAVTALDTAGAYVLDRAMRALPAPQPEIIGASEAHLALLQQARTLATQEERGPDRVAPEPHGLVDLLERTGRGAEHIWQELVETLAFFGAVLAAMSKVIWQPGRMRWTAFVAVMEEAGLDAVPIVAFLSFFVGMVVAFIGATTLSEFGATIFVVELIGFGILRELGGVLVAIIIAGRTNSAFTAQIGAMNMRQEVDAMTTLGLDPMHVLVAPRALAMIIMVPVLTFIGMLTGIAGGMTVSWLALDINPMVFLNRMQEFVPLSQFWIGMSKAPVFGLAIALIACRQGLEVGGSVQSLGQHTTKSVVQALFAIIVIDAVFAILYMELGL